MSPADLTATEQASLLEGRRLSARELLDASRKRAEATEPVVNALVTLDWERAESLADALDADSGLAADAPLRGLVTAHKDLIDTAGLRTTYGSPLFVDHVPTVSHPLVAVVAEAGSVSVGKTNTPEFGAGSHTFNPVHGLTRNPWDPTRSAGGSSGGAAAALACGSLSLADGSDLGGSLRNPASFCGIVGFRPSSGAIPGLPSPDDRLRMATEGPMGRTVADVALFHAVMVAGSRAVVARPPARLLVTVDHGDLPVDPDVRRVVRSVARELSDAGWAVEESRPPLEGVDECFETLRALGYAVRYATFDADDRVKGTVRQEIAAGLALDDEALNRAVAEEHRLRTAWDAFLGPDDVLLTPTSQVPPFPVGDEWVREVEGRSLGRYTDWMRSCSRLTVPGGPSISIPAGWSAAGLPIGIQLSGPRNRDRRLLEVAAAAEEVLGAGPRPPLETLAACDPASLPRGPIQ
ncbi:MAG: amidase family protein [Acidimicrobiales bacterium]|nr:amidase family protein [Acidimicrobiales bacterium]